MRRVHSRVVRSGALVQVRKSPLPGGVFGDVQADPHDDVYTVRSPLAANHLTGHQAIPINPNKP